MTYATGVIFVALTLGLGWAIRGHFGHEHGAAWAGAMGCMALILTTRKTDWIKRLPTLAAIGGIGWGVGGMMSYGLLVGMGRANDFGNVFYGLAMLAVVGGLYGFIGGGFLGLGLESSATRRPDWPALLTQMTAGGLLFWYVLIAQFEYKMTPPRSELWAACLGASVALAWYFQRHGYMKALRVAGYAALGAGFGFAFGNFLQTTGNLTALRLNWWNVMEFTLGFCGGLGMAYAALTREWRESETAHKIGNNLGLIFLFLILPAINLIQAFEAKEFREFAVRAQLAHPDALATGQFVLGWSVIVVFTLLALGIWRQVERKPDHARNWAAAWFFLYGIFYIVFSHIKKGMFLGVRGQIEQYAYWVILLIMAGLFFGVRQQDRAFKKLAFPERWQRWLVIMVALVGIIALLAWISIISHGEMPGAQRRF